MMSEIRRIGGSVNAVIVQLPERQHPGVVIQYDSLQGLLSLVRDARQQMLANDWDETRDLLTEIEQLISGYASAFEN
ncbi:DUF6959 family protein [Methylosinus sporium]|uniref:DUF6959 family protein n=1 Tax=Methylosinus sporium TaxID=428 RepID=UPI00132FBC91|nr:hypothetical protein [Methylosinus sporium]